MIFGLLFTDILLWGVIPFILLCCLWGDKKGWAAFVTIVLGLIAFGVVGWSPIMAMVTDPVWLSTALRNLCMYAAVGFGFSFLKWWVLSTKSARQFTQFLSRRDRNKTSPDSLASEWNKSYDNYYRNVLSVEPKTGGGWQTKYAKLTLAEYVTSWTIYWPFYTVLLVLEDLLRHVFDWFVEVFGKGFQKIANRSFASIE